MTEPSNRAPAAPWPPPDFDYGFPPRAPRPVAGCPACDQFVAAQQQARTAGDRSAGSDARVLMRQHLDEVHGS
jgi:hypothetical protein